MNSNIMIFSKGYSIFYSTIVFALVATANLFGILAWKKPFKNRIIHSFHHIFYFLVIVSSSISIFYNLIYESIPIFHILLLSLMILLPFFKRGSKVHRAFGILAFGLAIIPIMQEYFN